MLKWSLVGKIVKYDDVFFWGAKTPHKKRTELVVKSLVPGEAEERKWTKRKGAQKEAKSKVSGGRKDTWTCINWFHSKKKPEIVWICCCSFVEMPSRPIGPCLVPFLQSQHIQGYSCCTRTLGICSKRQTSSPRFLVSFFDSNEFFEALAHLAFCSSTLDTPNVVYPRPVTSDTAVGNGRS